MPWKKDSDTAALHPLVTGILRTVPDADDRTMNEVAGFVQRCATHAASVMTDYWFDVAIAQAMAPARWEVLVRQARQAGLITAVQGRGLGRRFRLVEDEQLFQIRYRADVEWDRQRDRDRKNPDLTMPVLLRDGDVCRYCGLVVNWADHRGGRGGTFDHRDAGDGATVDTYVVACRSCNSRRKNSPQADVDVPLQPAPARPYFSPKSRSLARLEAFYGPSLATRLERPTDTAASARPVATARPGARADHAAPGAATRATDPIPTHGSIPGIEGGIPVGTGLGSGSGRVGDGSGPVGSGSGSAGAGPGPRRRRGRRGGEARS